VRRPGKAGPGSGGRVHTFAGGELDRAAHLRTDESRIRDLHDSPQSRYLAFRALDPLVSFDTTARLVWLPRASLDGLVDIGAGALFLGLGRDGARFAVPVPDTVGPEELGPDGSEFVGVREVAPLVEPQDASILALGRSLSIWHAEHGFCPRCGHATSIAEAGHARACSAESCGKSQFPRTDPVVIMLIHRGGRCLLGRSVRAVPYPPGLHSCLAGYVEPGESIEEAVRRETWEEAGLRVSEVRYHSSQPWPFPSTLMIGCFAEALGGEPRIDPAELECVRWFDREELRTAVERWEEADALRLPPPITIAHQLARAWLEDEEPAA
jgi:NAD+ diphosphatase